MIKKSGVLDLIWESMDIINPYASESEKESLCKIEEKAEKIRNLMNKDSINLFEKYEESMFEYSSVKEKEAFLKGIKFASNFIFEIIKE